MPWLARILPLPLLLMSIPALAGAEGHYRAQEGPDVAAELILHPDGRFAYALAAGALDEVSQGHWQERDGTITLRTEPKPVPPHFEPRETGPAATQPFLTITWPNGRGIAGIDFRIACEDGTLIEDYTQVDGWTFGEERCDRPQWIELEEPIHAIRSPHYPIPPGAKALHFLLVPNDMGHIDLTDATATRNGDTLILTRPDGMIRFRRTRP